MDSAARRMHELVRPGVQAQGWRLTLPALPAMQRHLPRYAEKACASSGTAWGTPSGDTQALKAGLLGTAGDIPHDVHNHA